MTVKELIDRLSKIPNGHIVSLWDREMQEEIDIAEVTELKGSTVYIDFN